METFADGGIIIPVSILVAVIGWLVVDKIKAQHKKDNDQDTKIERLTVEVHGLAREMRDAVITIREALARDRSDIDWILKKH